MNANTLRFGLVRTAVFSVLLAAAAVYAQGAKAETPAASGVTPTASAIASDAIPVTATDALPPALRADLVAKVAASARYGARGVGLAMPAVLAQPATH